jgi:hypothetical protein
MIVLSLMILSLIVVFAIDTRQKRRKFLEERQPKWQNTSW